MRKILLAILILTIGWSVSREATAQPLRTVAFIDAVKFPPKAKQAHLRLRAALEESFSVKSWFLAETGRPIEDCGATSQCLAKVASDTGTQYVLRIAGKKSQEYAYDMTLDLYSTVLGGMRSSLATCDICDPGRMAEVASKAAVELLVSAAKEEAGLRERAKQTALSSAPPLVSQAPTPPPTAFVVPPAVSVTAPANRSWIPWALIGVGVVGVGYGGWALHEDGKSAGSCSPTRVPTTCNQYSFGAVGLVSLVGGGLLATAGVIWEITTLTHATTISASPNHVALNVRF